MELTDTEIRILGCLVEKATTTPDNYPLSTNALVNACNQSSNRDPVMELDDRTVDATMLDLRTAGLARTVTGGRANKHRHVLDEAWGVNEAELAVLAVLFLRGPQTPGELRTRTERLHAMGGTDEVERVLEGLAARGEPMVEQLGRRPGQKERRWVHLLGAESSMGESDPSSVAPPATDPPAAAASTSAPPMRREPAPVSDLAAEVARLRAQVEHLYELLGEQPPRP
jgi:uncharacterized protein YceH (UPF0502 family)